MYVSGYTHFGYHVLIGSNWNNVRFVPCISSAVTYYPKYKSTVVGIAIFGASLGMPTYSFRGTNLTYSRVCPGGIVVPFIVHRLLATVGFERTLQVLGLVCLVTSVFSIATVSSRNSHNRSMSRPWFRIKGVFDTNFILLTSGHAIASLGNSYDKYATNPIDYSHSTSVIHSIHFYCAVYCHSTPRLFDPIHFASDERRGGCWSACPFHNFRFLRALQSVNPVQSISSDELHHPLSSNDYWSTSYRRIVT